MAQPRPEYRLRWRAKEAERYWIALGAPSYDWHEACECFFLKARQILGTRQMGRLELVEAHPGNDLEVRLSMDLAQFAQQMTAGDGEGQ